MAEDDPTKKSPAATDSQLLQRILDKVEGIESDVKGLRGQMKANADQSLAQHEATRRYVARLATAVRLLWTKVFGSDPPPPADAGDEQFAFAFKENPTEPGKKRATLHVREVEADIPVELEAVKDLPVNEHLSHHDLTIAGMQGQLIALSSKTNELLDLQKEQMGRKAKPPRSLAQRLADGFTWAFATRDGRKFVLLFIAALAGLVGAFRPQPHAPETIVRYVPAPPAPTATPSPKASAW